MNGTAVALSRFRRRAYLAAGACMVGLMAAPLSTAGAQEPGVVYEPGSPSGKEYAIPLEEVRRDAGGTRPGAAPPLPFGIGLSQAGERRPATGNGRTRGASGSDGAGRGGKGAATGREEQSGLRKRLAEAQEAGAPLAWKLAPLLLVLLPGLLVGLLLARRSGEQPAV